MLSTAAERKLPVIDLKSLHLLSCSDVITPPAAPPYMRQHFFVIYLTFFYQAGLPALANKMYKKFLFLIFHFFIKAKN